MSNDETAGLLIGDTRPRYSFQSSIIERRRRQVRHFQCCICTIILFGVAVALVSIISYNINHSEIDSNASSIVENETLVLLTLKWPLVDKKQKSICSDDFYNLQEAVFMGEEALKKRDKMERAFPTLDSNSPSFRHQKSFAFSNKSIHLARMGYLKEVAQKYLLRRTNSSSKICNNTNIWLVDLEYNGERVICNKTTKYRSYDGSCNNLNRPLDFGVAFTPFRRSIPSDYADGISSPRIAKNSQQLPSARNVSVTVHRPIYKYDNKFTVMLAVWGQFIDHDITATALTQGEHGEPISCCPDNLHPECFSVLTNDSFYGSFNVTCLDFVRSAPVQTKILGPREQLNQVSAFFDGSVIYGNDKNVSDQLRSFASGKLKVYVTPDNRTLLPLSKDPNDGCNEEEQNKIGKYCFVTGDQRANENLHLTTLHLIWVRQHNRLASQLAAVNPHWEDEKIFQEARMIVGAQMQHITYNEFLPILIGEKLRLKGDVVPLKSGYYGNYAEELDPSIANNFATAAFRFGHTLIPELIRFLRDGDSNMEYVQMRKMLFNPYSLYKEDGLDRSLKSAMNTSADRSDTYFNVEVKNHLFERRNSIHPCGLDLVSLNIQRGRDHGLPGYTHFREHCKLGKVKNFRQLSTDIDEETLSRIQSLYSNVDDIDLYTGGISEKPLPGGIIGPTFTCLILDQFVRLRRGDRMWYENPYQPQAFTPDQLQEIRLTTLAGVICDNADNLENVQPFVMEQVREGNNYTKCDTIAKTDLRKWKEHRMGFVSVEDDSVAIKTN